MSTEDPEATPKKGELSDGAVEVPAADSAVEVPESRRDALREKAAQVSVKQKRVRTAWRSATAIVIVAIVAVVAVVVFNIIAGAANRPKGEPSNLVNGGFVVNENMLSVASSAGNGTLTTATPTPQATQTETPVTASASPTPSTGPVEVTIYADFQDPDAGTFEGANAKQLSQWVRENAVTLTYHPVSLVTGKSNGTKYSTRAMAALGCVATNNPEHTFAYAHELLVSQPAAGTDGLTDPQLADLAIAVGVAEPKAVRSCIEKSTYSSWAVTQSEKVAASKVVTAERPFSVLINGRQYVGGLNNSAEFAQAVLKASADAYYQTPTPTPTSSATPTGAATPQTNATPSPGK